MKLTLWLAVCEKSVHHGNSTLWTKTIQTGQAPGPGEEVVLWPSEEDGDLTDGLQWGVKSRYWDAEGGIHCELRAMVVDADEDAQRVIQQELANQRWTFGTWYTDVEGRRPEPDLERGGWHRYRP